MVDITTGIHNRTPQSEAADYGICMCNCVCVCVIVYPGKSTTLLTCDHVFYRQSADRCFLEL